MSWIICNVSLDDPQINLKVWGNTCEERGYILNCNEFPNSFIHVWFITNRTRGFYVTISFFYPLPLARLSLIIYLFYGWVNIVLKRIDSIRITHLCDPLPSPLLTWSQFSPPFWHSISPIFTSRCGIQGPPLIWISSR